MSRKNIFEIMAENNSIEREAERIEELFESEELLMVNINYVPEEYTIRCFVERFCFDSWKNRGHCIDLDDFLESVYYDQCCKLSKWGDVESFLIFIEIVFNCWKMVETYLTTNSDVQFHPNFNLLFDIMSDCLSQYNHIAVYQEDAQQVLVIEDKPEVTAVAEIVEPKLSMDIIKYNHYTLRGNINKKKAILVALGAELEPRQKALSGENSTLEDNIFFMLNNLNLRHNNITPTNKKYKEFVAQMDAETLEYWYDELYQMILLAFLELDQIERNSRVKTLKANIIGGKQ